MYQLTIVGITLYAFYLLILHKARAVLLVSYTLVACVAIPPIFAVSPLAMIRSLLISAVGAVILYGITMLIYRFIRSAKPSGNIQS